MLYRTCVHFSLSDLKAIDFRLIDKQRPGDPRKCDNDDWKQLLAENSAQT